MIGPIVAAAARDRRRGLRAIAGLLHRADLDRAGAGGVGHGRADHAGEDHARRGCWRAHSRRAASRRARSRSDDAVGDACAAPRMLPIRMNSGAATSGNEFIACAIFCGTIERRQAAERDEGEGREPHRGEQRQPARMASEPDRRRSRASGGHSMPRLRGGACGARRGSPHALGRARPAPCAAVTTPPSTIGAYIQAIEIGSDVASRS